MVKVLAWVALGVSLVFVIVAFTALFGWNSLGAETASTLAWWGAIPLAVVALLVTVAILVIGAFTPDSSES
jgi:uncharacterized membrane protein